MKRWRILVTVSLAQSPVFLKLTKGGLVMSDSVDNKVGEGNIDVVCTILIIAIVVAAGIFWVSGQ